MPGGRPIEYSADIITKAQEYLDSCSNEEDEFHHTRGLKSDSFDRILRVKLPSIEGLAVHLKIARSTIYEWEQALAEDGKSLKYPEFSDIIEKLRAKQAEMLINNGISGDYNPVITKVLLTKHGYREGKEVSGPDGGPVSVQPVTGIRIVKDGKDE